jgi:hypothetical protein
MPVAFAPKDSASILLFHRVQFIWIFLALAGLAAKTLIYGYWISLDFGGDREGHVPTMSRLWRGWARQLWLFTISFYECFKLILL